PFTIWPAIQPNAVHQALERGGFPLHTFTHRSFPAPLSHWSGRIWPAPAAPTPTTASPAPPVTAAAASSAPALGARRPRHPSAALLHHSGADLSLLRRQPRRRLQRPHDSDAPRGEGPLPRWWGAGRICPEMIGGEGQ
ncbi:osmotin-like protein, partial [Phtheirospermum japonicum]